MNRSILALCLTAAALAAWAGQTPPDAPEAPKKSGAIEIFSDTFVYDQPANLAVYEGNVRVRDEGMDMTCGIMTVSLPADGGKIERIVAERGVTIEIVDDKGERSRASGEKAVYDYTVSNSVTNDWVKLTGNPRLELPQGTLRATVVILDRQLNKLSARGNVTMELDAGSMGKPSLLVPRME